MSNTMAILATFSMSDMYNQSAEFGQRKPGKKTVKSQPTVDEVNNNGYQDTRSKVRGERKPSTYSNSKAAAAYGKNANAIVSTNTKGGALVSLRNAPTSTRLYTPKPTLRNSLLERVGRNISRNKLAYGLGAGALAVGGLGAATLGRKGRKRGSKNRFKRALGM